MGAAPDRFIKALAKTMNTDKNNAARLVMTESAFFYSTAQKDAYSELEVEKYEYLATLDIDTSEICQSMDGQVFDMKDYKVGVTAPPLHPWCRSVTVPYFADSFGERFARGEDGKTYQVPEDMTYEKWSKSRGLGSGKGKFYSESTIENIFKLDYNDDKEVEATFKEFAKAHVKSDREYAMVVTKKGEAYYIKGGTASVDITLVENLKDAKVIHNHPNEYGFSGDSFSIDDMMMFFSKELDELQLISEMGRYKVRYNGKYLNMQEANDLYRLAVKKSIDKGLNTNLQMEYPQFEAMKMMTELDRNIIFERIDLI